MMKPVAWQFYSNGKWLTPDSQDGNFRDWADSNGYETRDLYVIPDGYVLVPVEPTRNQLAAIWRPIVKPNAIGVNDVYDAMIKAAQEESE